MPIARCEQRRKRQVVTGAGGQRTSSAKICRPGDCAGMHTSQHRMQRWQLSQIPGRPRNTRVTLRGQEVPAISAESAVQRGAVPIMQAFLEPYFITLPFSVAFQGIIGLGYHF
jgi:hypothetical protein